jgi:hypothetical protein
VVLILAAAHFAFWYGLHIAGNPDLFQATRQYEMPDYVNYGDAEGRRAIARRLAEMPEPQLVFVRYSPGHTVREWIHNPADIDQARVVWALDSGPEQNAALRLYYPKRRAWLLEPDLNPPRLMPLSGQ